MSTHVSNQMASTKNRLWHVGFSHKLECVSNSCINTTAHGGTTPLCGVLCDGVQECECSLQVNVRGDARYLPAPHRHALLQEGSSDSEFVCVLHPTTRVIHHEQCECAVNDLSSGAHTPIESCDQVLCGSLERDHFVPYCDSLVRASK